LGFLKTNPGGIYFDTADNNSNKLIEILTELLNSYDKSVQNVDFSSLYEIRSDADG
jgi:hypothetical protein